METEAFEMGLKRLIELAKDGNLAIMCLEKNHKYCHRRFIAATLSERGKEVIYL